MRKLTEHQKELLREVRKGRTYADIAHERGKSPNTVQVTMSRIIDAMDAKNKLQAIRHAELLGEKGGGIDPEPVWRPKETNDDQTRDQEVPQEP